MSPACAKTSHNWLGGAFSRPCPPAGMHISNIGLIMARAGGDPWRECKMKSPFLCAVVFTALASLPSVLRAQTPVNPSMAAKADLEKEHCGQLGQPGTKYETLCADSKPSAPAPKRDLSGSWAGPIGAVQPVDPIPPMTPLGQKRFSLNRGNFGANVADSNDPINHCDPLGFPRNAVFELRGLNIGQMPNRTLILSQYQRAWREIWTDGRALPKNAGSDAPGAPDPRYYGYSVGHWEGDYTLVVDTVGTDENTWLDNYAHPHSAELHVVERYTRVDHNTLQVTVMIDDPVTYTKPFMLGKAIYKWIPEQDFEEQLCIPSSMELYTDTIAKPAGAKSK